MIDCRIGHRTAGPSSRRDRRVSVGRGRRGEQRLPFTGVHTAGARLRPVVDEASARGDAGSARSLTTDLGAVIGERGLDRTRLDLQSLAPEDCLAVDREIGS
jgi:hypothetical protein